MTPASREGFGAAAVGAAIERRRRWQIIPAIDRNAWCIAYVQRGPGRLLLFGCFALLLWATGSNLLAAPCAAAAAYSGRYRWPLIALGTLVVLAASGFLIDPDLVTPVIAQEGLTGRIDQRALCTVMVALALGVCGVLIWLWPKIGAMRWLRWPAVALILGFLALVVLAQPPFGSGLPRVLLWSFLAAFLPYLWFLAYALHDAGTAQQSVPVWLRMSVFQPFWGSSLTPFGKGYAYLRRFEALTPADLAVTQLKGLKLALWSALLLLCHGAFGMVVYDRLAIPRFDTAFTQFLAGAASSRPVCWASLVASFVADLLHLSALGGIVIASARMAGFRLLRNTYRPLELRTLAEFWNRYYFYYKELLVDHFFYPTFLRCFKRHRRLRIFFATFVAACVGNLMFHFLRDIRFVVQLGLRQAVIGEQSHAFYTLVLALGVGLSQMRPRALDRSGHWLRTRLLPGLWVVMFFCLLHVFDAPTDRVHTFWQRAQFLFYLLGVEKWM